MKMSNNDHQKYTAMVIKLLQKRFWNNYYMI